MGLTQSNSNVGKRSFNSNIYSPSFDDSYNHPVSEEPVIDFTEHPVSEDLLIELLSYVPARDLILNCRLVCKEWKSLVDAQSIWRLKCEREKVKLPTRKFSKLPNHFYQNVYLFSESEAKNLLKNPCGENKFEGWEVPSNGYVGFHVENPPAGSDPVPEEVGSQFCFATTYTACQKSQIVNLKENKVFNYMVCHDLVRIKVGEWYAARFDCAAEFKLKVDLYDDNHDIVDEFVFEYVEEQWTGREWHLVTHEFDNVTNVSFVEFHDYGKDRQFWAGHYGTKMTGAFVQLCLK